MWLSTCWHGRIVQQASELRIAPLAQPAPLSLLAGIPYTHVQAQKGDECVAVAEISTQKGHDQRCRCQQADALNRLTAGDLIVQTRTVCGLSQLFLDAQVNAIDLTNQLFESTFQSGLTGQTLLQCNPRLDDTRTAFEQTFQLRI